MANMTGSVYMGPEEDWGDTSEFNNRPPKKIFFLVRINE